MLPSLILSSKIDLDKSNISPSNNDFDKLVAEIEGNKAKEDIKLPEVPKEEITEDKNKKEVKEKTKKRLAVA